MQNEGRLIVVEGVDGAGTTTLAQGLAGWARGERMPVYVTGEPSTGPVGAMIRQVLTHRLVVHTDFGPRAPNWATMALLFAADRLDHLEAEILPILRDGVMVICDRYDLSSLAYQSMTAPGDDPAGVDEALAWIRKLNERARRPDLTIVVDVPADVAAKRRRARGRGAELYEDADVQRALVDAYATAEKLVPTDRLVHLDGVASPEAVVAAAVAAIRALPPG